jgi:hypothetical protein
MIRVNLLFIIKAKTGMGHKRRINSATARLLDLGLLPNFCAAANDPIKISN